MKYYLAIILLFVLFNLNFAQDTTKTNQRMLKHGLQFQSKGLINLSNFNNYTISYRYLLNNNSGLRIGLYTQVADGDFDIKRQLDSIINNSPELDKTYNYKVSIQYLQSIMRYNDFSLIFGGGPFLSYRKEETKRVYINYTNINEYNSFAKYTGYGLELVLGVEYKLIKNVILSGEYGVTFTKEIGDVERTEYYTSIVQNQTRIESEKGGVRSFSVTGIGVNLGIAVFF